MHLDRPADDFTRYVVERCVGCHDRRWSKNSPHSESSNLSGMALPGTQFLHTRPRRRYAEKDTSKRYLCDSASLCESVSSIASVGSEARTYQRPKFRCHLGIDAEPRLPGRPGLVEQHAQPIDRRVPP